MIYAGTNIKSAGDILQPVTVEYLYNAIHTPKQEIALKIKQLRIVRKINPSAYSTLKQQLPYIVTSVFSPLVRRSENFAYSEYFILDIDHLSEKGLILDDVRKKVNSDDRTLLSFESPGGDGLKILMKLKEKCYDAMLYKMFYKSFLGNFSTMYNLGQSVDQKTCDVTRACFVSCDEFAYYNKGAETVDMRLWLHQESSQQLWDQLRAQDEEINSQSEYQEVKIKDPDADMMSDIRRRLNPSLQRIHEKQDIFVPKILDDLSEDLKGYIESLGLIVNSMSNINYGKKITVTLGLKVAEVNLFYGKKGFSVVATTKTGTNKELAELVSEVVSTYLDMRL